MLKFSIKLSLVCIFYSLALIVFGQHFVLAQAELPSPPYLPLNPESGAQAIELSEDLTLILQWQAVEGAEEYYYQYWKKGETPETALGVSGPQSQPIASESLEPGAKYFWHVKSCANIYGAPGIDSETECSNYGPDWTFTFLLPPPSSSSFSPSYNARDVLLPVTLDWEDVVGAKSYELLAAPCPIWLEKEDERCFELPITSQSGSQYTDEVCFFMRNQNYYWQVASCVDENSEYCGPVSQGSYFQTAGGFFPLSVPILIEPGFSPEISEEIPIVSPDDFLRWTVSDCVYGYKLVIKKRGATVKTIIGDQSEQTINLGEIKELWDREEDLNQIYTWQVFSCWDEYGSCQDTGSEIWKFQTIGAPPRVLEPDNDSLVKIPFTLSWERIEGASSSYYQIAKDEDFKSIVKEEGVQASQVSIEYQEGEFMPDTAYWWRVKTCVDAQAKVCGEWSASYSFRTYPLSPPTNPKPSEGFLPATLTWDPAPGANFYQYKIAYAKMAEGETLEGCSEKEGRQIIPVEGKEAPITKTPKILLIEECLGDYQWRVRSCLDKDCKIATDWAESPVWVFTAKEPPPPPFAGILPCGRKSDISSTPYNERESCQLKHLGFIVQNVLDFLLWRLGLIVLGILAVVSGVISYLFLGGPNTLTRIRSIWKAAGMGYGIMLLAWFLINLFLAFIGFQVEFFGRWWELPF